jgi:Fe-S oxidoreductase
MAQLVSEGKLSMPKSKETVTYHDPCHVRHYWKYDAPRFLINSIRGVNFVEMKRHKDESFCCGAGGGTKIGYPEWALACSMERVREAQETGASVLLTNCPFCVSNLSEGAGELGSSIRVMDLNNYIMELSGEKFEDVTSASAVTASEKPRWFKPRGEKYRCQMCGFATSEKAEMARHMMEHTSED